LTAWPSRLSISGLRALDTDRARRCGFPEVIFGAGKTPEEVAAIGRVLLEKNGVLLVSRANAEHIARSPRRIPRALARARPLPHRRARAVAKE